MFLLFQLLFLYSFLFLAFQVKLTIMIEDPRDVERKRLLGIDDENAPTRDDLAAALEDVTAIFLYLTLLCTNFSMIWLFSRAINWWG